MSSEINFERRSSSASIPTDSRTFLMSFSEGEELPPRARRRYAARCFILIAGKNIVSIKVQKFVRNNMLQELTYILVCTLV